MMLVMVKEADLNRIEVPEDYEVLDATALGRRLGFKRDTVLAYSPGGTSDAYLAPTACLPWVRFGTRKGSGSGKEWNTKNVVSRSADCKLERWREG
jgi:hypothetical protein